MRRGGIWKTVPGLVLATLWLIVHQSSATLEANSSVVLPADQNITAYGYETQSNATNSSRLPEYPAPFSAVIHVPEHEMSNAQDTVRCVGANVNYKNAPLSFKQAMGDVPSSFEVVGVWYPDEKPVGNLTVVTQLSVTRLEQLLHQCLSFPGPISAAVYLSVRVGKNMAEMQQYESEVQTEIRQSIDKVDQLVTTLRNKTRTSCDLSVILVLERVADRLALALYPVNTLRNLARLQARTTLIAMLDVDMMVGISFAEQMKASPEAVRALINECKKKTLVVLPAFTVNMR